MTYSMTAMCISPKVSYLTYVSFIEKIITDGKHFCNYWIAEVTVLMTDWCLTQKDG